MRLNQRNLVDVFSGWMHKTARDIANSLGNLSGGKHPISLVQEALGKQGGSWKSLKGVFELAASSGTQSGATGRSFTPLRSVAKFLGGLLPSRQPT